MKTRRAAQKWLVAAGLLVSVATGAATPADALSLVTPTDYDGVALGTLVRDSWTTQLMTIDLSGQGGPASEDIGDLTGRVFQNVAGTAYIYEMTVLPQTNNPREFNTSFSVPGFSVAAGHRAGWSFMDAVAAGGLDPTGTPPPGSRVFSILFEDDGTIDFQMRTAEILNGTWGSGARQVPLTFFFESPAAPGISNYNVQNSHVAYAENWAPGAPAAPVPEPASLVLLGSGLVGLGVWARRKLKTTSSGA